MELLQDKITFEFGIYKDGTDVANPGKFTNHSDSIGYWIEKGFALSDAKVVKAEIRRIVDLQEGENIDSKFNALPTDEIKFMAGTEILFDLKKATLVPSIMTDQEYDSARLYRQSNSFIARQSRWNEMMKGLSDPLALANTGKIAFLTEELKKYQEDYLYADNKIFEAFITKTDHVLSTITGYPRTVNFATISTNSLEGLALWDDVNLGGPDAAYKTLVVDIIKNTIINTTQYES